MDHPGLLFGWKDPMRMPKLKKPGNKSPASKEEDKDDKGFTKEYVLCLKQRILWILSCNENFRKEFT